MPILDELKKKANGKADSANNIAEAIAQMDFSEGGVTPEEIAESVSAYLDEHLTNPTNPPIDTSLSIAGAAADSKETGDKITQLKEDLTKVSGITRNLFDPDDIAALVGFNFNNGVFTNSNTDPRSNFLLRISTINAINGSDITKSSAITVNKNGKVSATITPSSNGQYVKIIHDGSTKTLAIIFKLNTEANKTYTFSCNVTGYDPTTIGGIVFNDAQFEQNSVATDYIQHIVADDKVARQGVDHLLTIDAENTVIPLITWDSGQYINSNGSLIQLSGYHTSNAISLYPGQKIIVKAAGYNTIVSMIAKKNDDGSYTPLVSSTDANVNSYEYTATEYINVVVSTQTAKSYAVSLVTVVKASIDDLSANVRDLMRPTTPVQNLKCNGGLTGIFHKIGCIGNSLASGETVSNETGSNVYHDRYDYSWGQCLARMCGVTAYNFSRGGQSAITWMQEWANHATFTGNPCTLYLIGLGVNDSTSTSIAYTPVGTPEDIDLTDYTNNAETFYGQYAAIIQRIKQISEKAKIFVMTMPNLTDADRLQYNTAIEYMATIFDDVFVMDLATYGNDYFANIKRDSNLWISGHGTAVSYKMCADFIGAYIDWFVRNNTDKFKNVQFIDSEWNLT